MRKIEFIAPVAAMRGNLSGKQSLVYAENDNPAFDAPEGRQYARNYGPRFIGAKRSSDGKTYFAVKTKSAVKVSPMFRKQTALLAASSEIANICMHNLSLIQGLTDRYKQTAPEGWSFKRWLMSVIRDGLKSKRHFAFGGTTLPAMFVKNPYINTTAPSTATDISNDYPEALLIKFWSQLANDPRTFTIVGRGQGIAHDGMTFSDLAAAGQINIFGVGANDGHVTIDDGEAYLLYEGSYVIPGAEIVEDGEYTVTYDTPE